MHPRYPPSAPASVPAAPATSTSEMTRTVREVCGACGSATGCTVLVPVGSASASSGCSARLGSRARDVTRCGGQGGGGDGEQERHRSRAPRACRPARARRPCSRAAAGIADSPRLLTAGRQLRQVSHTPAASVRGRRLSRRTEGPRPERLRRLRPGRARCPAPTTSRWAYPRPMAPRRGLWTTDVTQPTRRSPAKSSVRGAGARPGAEAQPHQVPVHVSPEGGAGDDLLPDVAALLVVDGALEVRLERDGALVHVRPEARGAALHAEHLQRGEADRRRAGVQQPVEHRAERIHRNEEVHARAGADPAAGPRPSSPRGVERPERGAGREDRARAPCAASASASGPTTESCPKPAVASDSSASSLMR